MRLLENYDFTALKIGNSDRIDVVFLHGLLGSHRSGIALANMLLDQLGWTSVLIDLPGHGANAAKTEISTYNYTGLAEVVGSWLTEANLLTDNPILIGHSMGGKVAMALACSQVGASLGGLIVLDIAPVSYPMGRQSADVVLALAEIDPSSYATRTEIDAALAEKIPVQSLRQFVMTNIARHKNSYRWRIDVQRLAANLENLVGWPTPQSPSGELKAMLVYGGLSDYVTVEGIKAFERCFSNATVREIPEAAHWLHHTHTKSVVQVISQYWPSLR